MSKLKVERRPMKAHALANKLLEQFGPEDNVVVFDDGIGETLAITLVAENTNDGAAVIYTE